MLMESDYEVELLAVITIIHLECSLMMPSNEYVLLGLK